LGEEERHPRRVMSRPGALVKPPERKGVQREGKGKNPNQLARKPGRPGPCGPPRGAHEPSPSLLFFFLFPEISMLDPREGRERIHHRGRRVEFKGLLVSGLEFVAMLVALAAPVLFTSLLLAN